MFCAGRAGNPQIWKNISDNLHLYDGNEVLHNCVQSQNSNFAKGWQTFFVFTEHRYPNNTRRAS